MHIVKQEKFEGPLDLLLELIAKEKLNISDISLAKIADEFVRYVKALADIDKEELAEFLVVASQLILIKSRMILPGLAVSEEETESIAELEQRLAEYKTFKEVSKEIQQMFGKKQHMASREFFAGMEPVYYPPKTVTQELLGKIFAEVLNAIPKIEKLVEEKIKRIISLEAKIKELQSLLSGKVARAFSELVGKGKDKIETIVSFLALLELVKQKFISVEQKKQFGEI
ncbi:segregation/condensation protein A, partial [Patescibacteria group bacterium]|nr:segregation/condensation protein A [Patescibacteria group bacterium]